MAKILNGIGASSGIAIADIFQFKKEPIITNEEKISDVEAEIAKVEEAFKVSTEQINVIKENSMQKLGPEKAAIFEAHSQIINDPELFNQIKDMISNESINGLKAIETVFNNTKAIFESMDDPYFKERASDIEDVKSRVMYSFSGKELPNLLGITKEVIIIADDLTPSETALLDKQYIKGFATNIGGRTSHAAIMARTLEIPAVLGLQDITEQSNGFSRIAIDGDKGIVELEPNEEEWQRKATLRKELTQKFEEFKSKEAITLDGHKVLIECNIGNSSDVELVSKYGGDGVGLFRSEFLYMSSPDWPTEEEQFEHYKKVLEHNKDHLVVIRTLDIGGDKTLPYYQFPHEDNPFLGYRAIRLCLDKKEIFKTQLRALVKASSYGKLAIMFPMIAVYEEFVKAKEITLECIEEVKKEGFAVADDIQIGMMMEIPAAGVLAHRFAEIADFFSVGSNDLIQYSFAADRMNEKISYLYQPLNPSLLYLLNHIFRSSNRNKIWSGVCGEIGGDPDVIPLLLGLGLTGADALSMSPSLVPKAKYIISNIKLADCQELAKKALKCSNAQQVKKLVDEFYKANNIVLE